jgi:hypothetical protein
LYLFCTSVLYCAMVPVIGPRLSLGGATFVGVVGS